MKIYFFLTIAVIAEVIATSALKATDGFTKVTPSVIVIVGYIIAFYFMALTLRVLPVGTTYAIWSGLGILFVTITSYFLFKQTLDLPAILGMGLIILGVVIINLFSKSISH